MKTFNIFYKNMEDRYVELEEEPRKPARKEIIAKGWNRVLMYIIRGTSADD